MTPFKAAFMIGIAIITIQTYAMNIEDLHKKVYLTRVVNNSGNPVKIGLHKSHQCHDFDETDPLLSVDDGTDTYLKKEIPMITTKKEFGPGSSITVELDRFLKIESAQEPDRVITVGIQKNYKIGIGAGILKTLLFAVQRNVGCTLHGAESLYFRPHYDKQNISLITLLINKENGQNTVTIQLAYEETEQE